MKLRTFLTTAVAAAAAIAFTAPAALAQNNYKSEYRMSLVLGFIAVRLKLPALVGYLVAGILIGPYSPLFVADIAIASQLAEIGVMLLMFGVGLHFSTGDLLRQVLI